jgi:uncharacterized repeat protein (TIGR02543 family)
MKKHQLYFVILAVMVSVLFWGCDSLAELAHGPKPEPPPVTYVATYTVTYNINGGSGTTPAAQTASSGSTITLSNGNGVTRSGYTFGGWNANATGTGTNYNGGSLYTVTGNITLYASWAESSTVWTVKFEANGGSAVGNAVVLRNTPVGRPVPDPVKTGYTFDGWYTNAGLTAVYNFSSIVTDNITLYAKWNPITYTVAYNANGGTGTTANSSHTYDVDKNLTANGFTYTGYTFAGWARTSTGAVEFTNSQSVKNLTATAGATVTLYAKWTAVYTVTFNINSGSGTTPSAQTASSGSTITLPSGSGLSRSGYTFGGWNTNASGTGTNYSAGSSYTVTGSVTLYAKWNNLIPDSVTGLAAKLAWLQTNAQSNGNYIVEVTANESISPTTLSYSGRSNIGITLRGTGTVRTVSLSSVGSLFAVASGVTLVLDNNITLQGRSDNDDSLVGVESGGTLVMNTGSRITGNTGGGVFVVGYPNRATFTMNGGEISGNTAGAGGGVYLYDSGGSFTMSGTAKISGNTASIGGGVYTDGSFTMSGGEISGNTANDDAGGGVYVAHGTFTKTSGTIYGYSTSDTVNSNVAKNSSGTVQSNRGHAVYVQSNTAKRKETTAGPGVNLSWDGSVDPPTFSGAWDN